MHCGAAVPAAPQAQPQAQPDARTLLPGAFEEAQAKQRRTVRWLAALGVVGAVAAALVGLQMAGVLGVAAERPPQPVLQATGAPTDPQLLRAEGSTAPPVLERAGERVVMPREIRDWLEHLRRTEDKRMRLATDQMGELMVSLTLLQGGDPLSNLGDLLDEDSTTDPNAKPPSIRNTEADGKRLSKQWAELTRFFNSVPPPAECVPIRNEYDQVVRETGAMMNDVIGAMTDLSDNPQAALSRLTRMRGTSKDRVDKPAIETDTLVDEICRKYNTRKWFDIQGDVGGGLLGKNVF